MTVDISYSPLLEAIQRHSASFPEKVAVYGADGVPVTYAKLWRNIRRAASLLAAKDVRAGDRVLISAEKETEFIFFYFAAHLIGAVNVVVDAAGKRERNDYIASVTDPVLAIGVECGGVSSLAYADIMLPEREFGGPYPHVSPEDTADIMFTSGTTGNPKGVLLSHFNIFSSAENINGFIGNGASDIELVGLPICHSFGLGRIRCNMLTGATVALHNGFANLKSVFNAFEKYGVTGFGMVPAVWAYIRRFSGTRIGKYAPQMRYIEIGSAAMPLDDKKLLLSLFPDTRICMHYGLTEASRALFMEFHEYADNLSVAGRPVSDKVEVRVIGEDGSPVEVGREGEICVKGNMVTSSYLLPDDNREAFADGYFRTGDWGYVTESGDICLVARKKELINVGGKKVSPVEIEDKLTEIGVGECMCVAVKDPEGILGEVPKVLLVKGTFTLPPDEIREMMRERLETFKQPKFYEIVDSIPKTESGKKKRT